MKSPRPRGNERLQKMRADPERADRVAAIREQMRELDRTHALNLAAIRRAAALTQIELSQRLGVGQGAISKLENQDDWLLSTLAGYIKAAGAQDARLVVTINGQDMEFALTDTPEAGHRRNASVS
ncbi:MAG: helix-turn-helix domain-containing protein [Mycobacterium sp.]